MLQNMNLQHAEIRTMSDNMKGLCHMEGDRGLWWCSDMLNGLGLSDVV